MTSVVLAGGGTAGHVNPLISTAVVLRERGHAVRAVGTASGLETTLVPQAGIELDIVERVPFPRRPSLDAVRFPARFRTAVKQASEILTRAEADVAVGFGGFASTPVYLAARSLGIPVVIHEQNAKPGLANKLGARFAAAVALTFASTPLEARRGRTATVGLPLRPAIAALAVSRAAGQGREERVRAAEALGLDPDLVTLVVTGGSLGAQRLNEVMVEALSDIDAAGIQVLHLTGKGKDAEVRAANPPARYHVLDYLTSMEQAYAVADAVLCRSGAGTVAELCALGLPAFFVPLAIGNGEQEKNAADVVTAGGALLARNKDFTVEVLRSSLLPLLQDPERLRTMGKRAAALAPSDSAAALADIIEEVAR